MSKKKVIIIGILSGIVLIPLYFLILHNLENETSLLIIIALLFVLMLIERIVRKRS